MKKEAAMNPNQSSLQPNRSARPGNAVPGNFLMKTNPPESFLRNSHPLPWTFFLFVMLGANFLRAQTIPVAVDATSLTWTTGGNASWSGQTAVKHDGLDAAQSGAITHNQSSYVETTITGPASVGFWWKVSSQTNFDFLRVSMDGNDSNSISGEVDWVRTSLAVPAGGHTIRWTYSKDGSVNTGSDKAWLDQVTLGGDIPPLTVTNGGITSILLFADDLSVPSAYQSALESAGRVYQLFTDESAFNTIVATSSPNSTLVIVDSISAVHNFAPLILFVGRGGRSIVAYSNLDADAPLAAAFNATTVQDIFTPLPVYDWGGSYFFSQVTSPLGLVEHSVLDDGDKLRPTAGGVAVVGYTVSPTDGEASVVIGNSGRTILNGMALQNATNAPAAAQFALNEISYLLAPFHIGGRVAVLGAAVAAGWNDDVRQKLLGTGTFETVDIFQANTLTPALAQLQPYAALLVYSDDSFANATNLGNALADYVDAGGGVVVSTFGTLSPGSGSGIDGRLRTGGYLPFVGGATSSGAEITLVADQAVHPILAGAGSLSGGTASQHNLVTLAPNAALVAHWSNGRPLVMTKLTGQGRVVGLNFFPPSETVSNNFWRTNTSGARLMANALLWSGLPDCTLQTNYAPNITFSDALGAVTVTMAFDGTNYWSASGVGDTGARLARYSAAGVFQTTYAPGIDFNSLFTDASGRLYARGIDATLLRQTTPGTFVSHVILTGGTLDIDSSVVLNGNGNEYVALNLGTVNRWSTNGSFLGTVTLAGFGALAGETNYPQNLRLAAVGQHWLTYNGNRTLSIWNQSGTRLGTTTLQNAGTLGNDPTFSFSYCAGKVFIVDVAGGTWRGYDICTSPVRPILSDPQRLGGGKFQFNLQAGPTRTYVTERSTNFINWAPASTNTLLAPNGTITDNGAVGGVKYFYRTRTP